MDDTTADDRDNEVVTEFDQTNGKAPGLVGDGSADGHREPLVTRLVGDVVDGTSDERRRD